MFYLDITENLIQMHQDCSLDEEEIREGVKNFISKCDLLKEIGVNIKSDFTITVSELLDILQDEVRLKTIVTKLKYKTLL